MIRYRMIQATADILMYRHALLHSVYNDFGVMRRIMNGLISQSSDFNCSALFGAPPVDKWRLVSMPFARKGIRSLAEQGIEKTKCDRSVMISDV